MSYHRFTKLNKGRKYSSVSPKLGLLSAGLILALSAAKAEATNYYVSPSGNNTTGLSYQTAWNELNQIKWSALKANDIVYIDGGASGITYKTILNVPSNAPKVTIDLSTDKGHTGMLTIDGTTSGFPSGIQVAAPVQLFPSGLYSGNTGFPTTNGYSIKSLPVRVQNWRGPGLFLVNGTGASVSNMEFCHNQTGILLVPGANSVTLNSCLIHDNTNANISNEATSLTLNYCWIYNSTYPANGQTLYGLQLLNDHYTSVYNSVIGPGLSYGAYFQSSIGSYFSNSTFVDSVIANQYYFGNVSGTITNCTSFSTPKNPTGLAHYNLIYNGAANKLRIMDSTFYGGQISVPTSVGPLCFANGGFLNYEYNVTGNTTALASQQLNPQFEANVGAFPNNVSIATLVNADFTIPARSPAYGHGAQVTSGWYMFPWLFPWSAPTPTALASK